MAESKFKNDLRCMMEKYGTVNVVLQMAELCQEYAQVSRERGIVKASELWEKNGEAIYEVAYKIKIN